MPETPEYSLRPHAENVPGCLVRRKNDGSIDGAGSAIDAQGTMIPTGIAPYSAMAAPPVNCLMYPGMGATAGGQNSLQNRLIAYPVYLPKGLLISAIGFFLTGTNAVGTAMVGIYNNLATFFPGSLLVGSAVIPCNAGANTYKLDAIAPTLIATSGFYWAALWGGGANLHQVRTLSGPGSNHLLGFSSTGAIITSIENPAVFGAAMLDPYPIVASFMRTANAPLVMATLDTVIDPA